MTFLFISFFLFFEIIALLTLMDYNVTAVSYRPNITTEH